MVGDMDELTQGELYSPMTQEAWRALLSWFGFFFQIFSSIIGVFTHYPLLSFSSFQSSFNPLPSLDHDSSLPPPSAIETTSDHCPLQKLTVVLDLDETLVCAYETSSLSVAQRTQAIQAGLNWFEMEYASSDKDAERKQRISYVIVFERPGLKEFLRQLSEFADLVLFTAGLEDTENQFSHRLYRPSTVSTEFREHVKDLTCISKDLCRIVIVDNNPFNFLLQPDNGIPCIPFSVGQPHDTQLLDVMLPLLKHLSDQKDVRRVLSEKFHMPEWFQKQGIPASG